MAPNTGLAPEDRTNLDMLAARAVTHFDVDLVRNFVHDGQNNWEIHSKLVDALRQDPVFEKSQRPFLTRKERYKRAIRMTTRVYELQDKHGWIQEEADRAIRLIDEEMPIHLSSATFQPVFLDQCGPYLRAKYGDLVVNRGIQGCYLQTELGHGSDVGSLETTATFIPETQEFEIHSPTLTSSKWWIGALGKTATHGIVQAKLILGGRDMGPHMFFVPLRSLKDHKWLPGVVAGDIGPKVMGGYASVDNGFARFDHVRIPREYMLSQYSQVTQDGQYVKPPHAKLSYGGMMWVRIALVQKGGWYVAKAATVAIRYCTVRRQSSRGSDSLERRVITYPAVHARLLPVVSHAYAFILIGREMMESMNTMSKQLTAGDASMVSEMHLASSALKILVSSIGTQDIEVARRAMGGHGYSEFSGLGRWYADWLPTSTYEGDNYVLDLQIVRGALKAHHALHSAPPSAALSPATAYLRWLLPSASAHHAHTQPAWADPHACVGLLERRAAALVAHRATCDRAEGGAEVDAGMEHRVSTAAVEAYLAMRIGGLIVKARKTLPKREADVLSKLFTLGLLHLVEGGLTDILSFSLLPQASAGEDPTTELRATIKQLCAELLPEAIGLTDAFGFTDWELDSALGVFDGDVYKQLWARAQQEPLNATEVTEGYSEYLKPMFERGQRIVASQKAKL